MTEITYDLLTPAERRGICNGCGGKGGWVKPPDLWSRSACDRHDLAYFIGGSSRDRREADRRLYADIKALSVGRSFWRRAVFRAQAWLYYRAVRWFGSAFFRFADTKLTLEDLRS